MISVCIPVGPFKGNKDWLTECLDSVVDQTILPEQIILIDDGAQIPKNVRKDYTCKIWKAPWHIGISHAFNFGVMLAPTECVFMLGSDDTLEPTCLEECWNAYLANEKKDAYYSVTIKYMDTGELQPAPCNAAMVTKGLWRLTGGFPIETAIGMGDSTLLSIILANKLPGYSVAIDTPLYNYRRHPDIHTFKLQGWWHITNLIRGKLTEDWTEQEVRKWSGNY